MSTDDVPEGFAVVPVPLPSWSPSVPETPCVAPRMSLRGSSLNRAYWLNNSADGLCLCWVCACGRRTQVTLYLAPKATMIERIINLGMIDRRDQGFHRPWGSAGRHALLRNKPEQLRGPVSPYHARLGYQGGRDDEYSGLCRY